MAKAAATFGVTYKPQPKRADGTYTVRHSTDIDLVGPGGRIFRRFALNSDPKDIAMAVREFAPRVPAKSKSVASAQNSEGGDR